MKWRRMSYATIDLDCASHARPPRAVTPHIDDTVDAVHGHGATLAVQHASRRTLFPADPRVCDRDCVPGCGAAGALVRRGWAARYVASTLRRLVRRIRQSHWPHTRGLTIRSAQSLRDRHEAMAWCEANGIDAHPFLGLGGQRCAGPVTWMLPPTMCGSRAPMPRGSAGGAPLCREPGWRESLEMPAACCRAHRSKLQWPAYPLCCDQHRAWQRRWLYQIRSIASGVRRKTSSSCSKSSICAAIAPSCCLPLANQVRLLLHTAAYWLMLTLRDAIPKPQPLASAEFKTVRLCLIKIAARVIETATRVRIAFAASCPQAALCSAASPSASSPPDRNTAGAPSPHTPGPANIQRRHEPD